LYRRLATDAVAVTRATREHEDIRQGSSVRGAIDLTLVCGQLFDLTGVTAEDDPRYPEVVFDAMIVALSGRIFLDETVDATPEAVLRQIWEDPFPSRSCRGGAGLKSRGSRLPGTPQSAVAGGSVAPLAPPPEGAR